MSSIRFDGISFSVYSHDHWPPHVHAKYAGIKVIVELSNGRVTVARRKRPIRPSNAKRSDVKKILQAAAEHADILLAMWEQIHG